MVRVSLQSLASLHSVTIQLKTESIGSAGGTSYTYSTIQTGVRCRVQPVSATDRVDFQVRGFDISHAVHFASNPNIDEQNCILFGTRRLHVRRVLNINEMNRLWIAYCSELDQGVEP